MNYILWNVYIYGRNFFFLFFSFAKSTTLESTNQRNWPSLRMIQSFWWKLSAKSNPMLLCPSRKRYVSCYSTILELTQRSALPFLCTSFSVLNFECLFLFCCLFLLYSPTQSSIPLPSRSKRTRRRNALRGGSSMNCTKYSWTRTLSTIAWPMTWQTVCSVREA